MVLAFDEHGASRPVVMGKELAFATSTKAYRVSFVTNTIATAPLASAVGLTSTSAGIFVAGARSFGRVQLPSEAVAHSGAKVASSDDSEWY
jgi:hypothetical protein